MDLLITIAALGATASAGTAIVKWIDKLKSKRPVEVPTLAPELGGLPGDLAQRVPVEKVTVKKEYKQVDFTGLWDANVDVHTGTVTYTSKNTASVTIQHPPLSGAANQHQVHNIAAGTVVVVSPEGVVTILEPSATGKASE
jgi:hypothetical protein